MGANEIDQLVVGVGTGAVNPSPALGTQLALWNYFDGSFIQLATSNYLIFPGNDYVIDMAVSLDGTATVFVNGATAITWTGTIQEPSEGTYELDCAGLAGQAGGTNAISEVVVTQSTDTRSMSMQTLPPTGPGTVNNWDSGNYSNINPVTINDASYAAVNSINKDLQATLPELTGGDVDRGGHEGHRARRIHCGGRSDQARPRVQHRRGSPRRCPADRDDIVHQLRARARHHKPRDRGPVVCCWAEPLQLDLETNTV